MSAPAPRSTSGTALLGAARPTFAAHTAVNVGHRAPGRRPPDADPRWTEELARRVFALPGVVEAPSRISVPGARALVLAPDEPAGPPEAFLIGREFAHLHPDPDHSLHAMLPEETVKAAVAAGWAEPHPVALQGLIPPTAVMVYAPRDEAELAVVEGLVRASHAFARAA